jgi:hypothetical protein
LTIPVISDPVPDITADQMREVDRLMVDDYGIGLPIFSTSDIVQIV